MSIRLHLAVALALAALGLAPGAAHLLELPVKLKYSDEQYAQVTSTLYAWYGSVGGILQVGAVLAVGALALRLRHSPQSGLVVASALALVASVLLWAATVAPVNSTWSSIASTSPGDLVAAYARLRPRWEYGHVAAFIAWLAGTLGLIAFTAVRFR